MESNPEFNLRWNNHSYNILQVFLEQLTSESLVDVTLSCQGQFLKAHKMVLSACSSYFQDLFIIHQVKHPVIILNGIKFSYLKMVVEFMYKGEARVLESDLNGILAVAEALQVKGLCNVRNDDKGSNDHCDEVGVEEMDGAFISESNNEDPLSDPLEISDTLGESTKPTRKRKRASELKSGSTEDKSSKVCRAEPTVTESLMDSPAVRQPRNKPAKLATTKAPASKITPSKSSKAAKTSPKSFVFKNLPKITPAKVYPSKAHASKTSSDASTKDLDRENTEVLPFVQVSLKEPADDDIDLATSIKVEPLFIRDIDDNDTSWDDPTRLVIDLPVEDSEETRDGIEEVPNAELAEKSVSKDSNSVELFGQTEISTPVKKSTIPKPKLKVRPASELVAPHCSGSAQVNASTGGPEILGMGTVDMVDVQKARCMGGKIPRPPNAFMIFANEWRKKLALENPTESNKQISVRLGQSWKNLTTEKKEIYFNASRRADEEHKRKYPNYFYSPKEARLRKSMRQKACMKISDPLKLSPKKKAPLKSNTKVYIAKIGGDGQLCVKEEVMYDESNHEEANHDESNHQNLEEEFLKMVEEGHVEAETEEESRELECLPETQSTESDDK